MALAQLRELVNGVKVLTEKLFVENDKVTKILDEYPKRIKNCVTVADIKKDVEGIKRDLETVEKHATEKLVITFVGAINSGKSSLINALLREDRLPTACGESTVCSFKICTTEEKSWSVHLDEKNKTWNEDEVEEIKQLFCKIADPESRAKRRELSINTKSVVQVNWPQTLCRTLPENVVLHDTPGFGKDPKVFKVVKKSCEETDVIVAVVDTMSPMLERVSMRTPSCIKGNSLKTLEKVSTLINKLNTAVRIFYT